MTCEITVCMATYNGARYLREQLQSILLQLSDKDEVVVVDDGSTDGTLGVIEELSDSRVRVFRHDVNKGHVATFEESLYQARGELIFLSEQDDVWLPGRVVAMRAALLTSTYVASNFCVLGADDDRPSAHRLHDSDGHHGARNLVHLFTGTIPYFGCAMGFRREVLSYLLPFPAATEAHGHWIAIAGNLSGGIGHLERNTVARRVHE